LQRAAGILGLVLAIAAAPAAAVGPPPDRPSGLARANANLDFVARELLVRFEPGTDAAARAVALAPHGASIVRELPLPRLRLVRLPQGKSVRASARALERDPRVRYAEPNYLYRPAATPNDPRFSQLWGLHQLSDADIDAPEAWDVTTGSASVVVAVVDSGVAYNHPELSPNIWTNDDPLGGGDDDGNGFVDDTHGWDFFDGDAKPLDQTDHGTHVAGTIGAQGNDATGVVGVNWDVSVMPLRVGNAYGLDIASVVEAFHYAAANGARIVNGSFGGPSASSTVRDMIAMHSNVLFVFAAGNDGLNLGSSGSYPCEEHLAPPAGGGLANVICVAATSQTDAIAPFSNRGAASVHLAAPGVGIWSSVPAYDAVFGDGLEGTLADFNARWGDRLSTVGDQLWTQSTAVRRTGVASLTDSPAGNYADNSDTSIRPLAAVNLSGRIGCALDYQMRLAVETPGAIFHDLFLITAGTTTSASAHTVAGWAGSTSGFFVPLRDDLSMLDGQPTVYLRFRLVSDTSINLDGVYVDDILVKCLSSTFDANDYQAFDGTSMATPHVAGVAALVLAANPLLTPTELKGIILANVDVLPGLTGLVSTNGRLNASKAVSAADDPPPPPPPPSLSVANAAPVLEGNSGTTNASFTVSLSAPSAETVTVNWNTANGTAVAETDFLSGAGPLTFSPGQTLKTVTVAVEGDTVDEPDEAFAVSLSSPDNATILHAVAQGTITDDDEPPAPLPPPIPPPSLASPPSLPAGCTQAGTPGPDVLRGTPRRDVICGLGGNDRIDGLGGNDVLFGGPGNDILVGGGGSDTLWGQGGRDTLLARRGGKDTLLGGVQRDRGTWDRGLDRVRSVEQRLR
jgi:subtilisin family serine protease